MPPFKQPCPRTSNEGPVRHGTGKSKDIYAIPTNDYTRSLVAAAPIKAPVPKNSCASGETQLPQWRRSGGRILPPTPGGVCIRLVMCT